MKRIRLKARAVPQPCMFRDKCYAACEWCDTHSYSEACVPTLQARVDLLQMVAEAWLEATSEARNEATKKSGPLYTLEEIAEAICGNTTNCDETCVGWKYHCRKGNTGTLQWLREVMGK